MHVARLLCLLPVGAMVGALLLPAGSALASTPTADRYAGTNRYDTAAQIALDTVDPLSPPTADHLAFWCAEVDHLQIAGGPAAISTSVATQAGVAATCR